MGCNRFGNTATPARLLARPLYGVPADVAADCIAAEEPPLGFVQWPPVAQDLQQLCGKHHISIHPPFALFDSDDHSLAIDITNLQADSLRDTQSGSVADSQNRAMFNAPHRAQKLQNLFRTQDDRQLMGHLGRWNDFFQAPVLTKGDFVEKTKGCYGQGDRACSELSFVL